MKLALPIQAGPTPAERFLLRHVDKWGPSTLASAERLSPQPLRHLLRRASEAAIVAQRLTCYLDDRETRYALTPGGVAWLDEDDERRAAKAASKRAARAALKVPSAAE